VTSGDEIPPHTAVPVIHPQTPPPVSETPPPMRAERHWGKVGLVATACVALGAGAAFSVRYTRPESVDHKAASLGARERAAPPAPAAPVPVAVAATDSAKALAKAEPVATAIPAQTHPRSAAVPAKAPNFVAPPPAALAVARSVPVPAEPRPAVSATPKPRRAKPKASPDEPLPGSGL